MKAGYSLDFAFLIYGKTLSSKAGQTKGLSGMSLSSTAVFALHANSAHDDEPGENHPDPNHVQVEAGGAERCSSRYIFNTTVSL